VENQLLLQGTVGEGQKGDQEMFMRRQYLAGCGVALAALALFASSTSAEKVNMPPSALRRIATDVVVGKVVAISQRTATEGDWRVTRYTAQVKVLATEKGSTLKKGRLFSARYWHRSWAGLQRVAPLGTDGYRGLPSEGETLRIYLARNAYDGFTYDNHDGGYNVIGANGFEPIITKHR
jgi:hypothetical protein